MHIVPSSLPILNRPFIGHVKRCDEALHRLDNIEQLLRDKKVFSPRGELSRDAEQELYDLWAIEYQKYDAHPINILNEVISETEQDWMFYQDITRRQ